MPGPDFNQQNCASTLFFYIILHCVPTWRNQPNPVPGKYVYDFQTQPHPNPPFSPFHFWREEFLCLIFIHDHISDPTPPPYDRNQMGAPSLRALFSYSHEPTHFPLLQKSSVATSCYTAANNMARRLLWTYPPLCYGVLPSAGFTAARCFKPGCESANRKALNTGGQLHVPFVSDNLSGIFLPDGEHSRA